VKLTQCRASSSPSPASDPSNKAADKATDKASDHKNEGFLKSAWHKLTHQHDNLDADGKPKDNKDKKDEEEPPKKASGSGS